MGKEAILISYTWCIIIDTSERKSVVKTGSKTIKSLFDHGRIMINTLQSTEYLVIVVLILINSSKNPSNSLKSH